VRTAKFKDDVFMVHEDVGSFITGSQLDLCWRKGEVLKEAPDGLFYPENDHTGFAADDELIEID
jgi:hypothetical protein